MGSFEQRVAALKAQAKTVRFHVVDMIHAAQSGHPGGSLSVADILTALYMDVLRVDPQCPRDPERDRFVLSKGHACPVWYACLALRGFFPVEELRTLRRFESRLQGHPVQGKLPGIDVSTGSLGVGFGEAVGLALEGRMLGKGYKVWVVLGDGEHQEGLVWEAAAAASRYSSRTSWPSSTSTACRTTASWTRSCRSSPWTPSTAASAGRWSALTATGWRRCWRPSSGRGATGLPLLHRRPHRQGARGELHGEPPEVARQGAERRGVRLGGGRDPGRPRPRRPAMSVEAIGGEAVKIELKKASAPTRRHFAERMVERGATDGDFVVFESDIGHSTYSYLFGEKYPGRYFNMGIAEMVTVSAAAGFACEGRPVFVCGYGVFLTMRAVEVVRSFVCYPHLNVKFLSSHGGLTAAVDGVTHQATEDIAFVGTLPGMRVLAPCDRVSARAAFDTALETPGPVFTRLMRDPLWDLYPEGERFLLGGSKLLRAGGDLTIATYGDMVLQSLRAADELAGRGISAEVLDLYSLRPCDAEAVLASVARTGALLVVENHQRRNGLGYELAVQVLKHRPAAPPLAFENLGLDDRFGESGDYEQVIDKYGLSARRIAAAAEELVRSKR